MLDLLKAVFSDSACELLFCVLMFAVTLLIVVVDICIFEINKKLNLVSKKVNEIINEINSSEKVNNIKRGDLNDPKIR